MIPNTLFDWLNRRMGNHKYRGTDYKLYSNFQIFGGSISLTPALFKDQLDS